MTKLKHEDKLDDCIGGQKIVRENEYECVVLCAKCKEEVNVIKTAYFDPYQGKVGKYVHYECLSKKRADEIKALELSDARFGDLMER